MTYKVRLSDNAEADLGANANWWARHRSYDEAMRWLVGFHSALQQLDRDPERFPLASEASQFRRELRQLNYGLKSKKTHRAVFEVQDQEVVVLAIRHLAQGEIDFIDLN